MTERRMMLARRSSQEAVFYESITRKLRWSVILIVLITLPLHQPQTVPFILLISLACMFNLSRYSNLLMRSTWYSSRFTFLAADNILVTALLIEAGGINNPYTFLLALVIVTAAYWYGKRGAAIVTTFQILALSVVSFVRPFHSITISPVSSLILIGCLIVIFAILVEQLTSAERVKRIKLEKLEYEKTQISNRLLALINSLGDAVATVDENGFITIANTALTELSDREADLVGKRISTVLPLQHAFKPDLDWSEVLRTAPSRYRDYTLKRGKGNVVSLELTITPITQNGLEKSEFIILCHDITQDRTLDEQRQEFISVASHELRTPLAFIEGALSLALATPKEIADPDTLKFLKKAYHNVLFLSSLVSDLTLLSKAQNDALEIQPQVVEPKQIVNHLIEDYAPQAKEKYLDLKAEFKPDTTSVLSTEHHIEQILRNLISNAIKYTKTGEIVVGIEPAQNNGILFSVRDTGPGISQADQKKLFTKYFRSEDYQTRETGGTGLGLYICQEIAKRIDAKLWCRSRIGHGATFYLEVPPFSKLDKDQKEVVAAGVSDLVNQL